MSLSQVYKEVAPSIVAIVAKTPNRDPQDFPSIIGTGFVVGEGIIATNDHVIHAVQQLASPTDVEKNGWPAQILMFHYVPNKGMYRILIPIYGVFTTDMFAAGDAYYGPPDGPDLGFIHVNVRSLPKLTVYDGDVLFEPGMRIATSGFTMGTDLLTAPGYLHQLVPSLQEGIVSAVLPFSCTHPHAVLANIMIQGGASGSPMFFSEKPEVVGVLFERLVDKDAVDEDGVPGTRLSVSVPTNFSYFVPHHFLQRGLENVKRSPEFVVADDVPILEEITAAGLSSLEPH